MVEKEKTPYGYIYRATNVVNDKVYLGQTTTDRWDKGKIPIEERWKEEVGEAYRKQARGENLRYVENAITKYGPENFELVQQDIAYSQEDLDQKETKHIRDYDSMNPDKGYNLKEGGLGGRLSEVAKEKVSRSGSEKWQNDLEYREKQTKERRERASKNPEWHQKMTEINREMTQKPEYKEKMSKTMTEKWQEKPYQESVSNGASKKWRETNYRGKQTKERQERAIKNPEWRQKMTEINRERAKDPQWKEKMSQVGTNKWRESEYRRKQGEERRERAKDPQWLAKMREIGKQYRKEIPDKREFLKEIKENMPKKDMLQKYDMGKNSFGKRIQEMFGPNGPKNYTELKNYLRDKNVDDVLKDIEERNKENEPKPGSENENPKENEESKAKENIKESPKGDTEKEKKSAEIEENIESENKEMMDEDTSKKEEENNVSDSEENMSKGSSNSEVEAEHGKNVENMEELNMVVKDYAGIDKNSSEREQDIKWLDENQDSKNLGQIRYIDIDIEDIESIATVKDIKAAEEKDYTGVDEGAKKEVPDYAFIDNILDNTKEIEENKSDKRTERGKEYRHT